MKIRAYRHWLLALLVIQAAGGCTFIKSLFPDKERDYQFRAELPELIIPDDLKAHTLPDRLPPPGAAAVSPVSPASTAVQKSVPATPAVAAKPMPVPAATAVAPTTQNQPLKEQAQDTAAVRGAGNSSGVSSLQIDQPRSQAWRLVARALSRQKIEIVERNMDKAYFYVKYDPDEVKPSDSGIWDEIAFLFGEDPSHELEYRISLLETGPQMTEVTVQNSDGQTISNRTTTHLLKLITDGINLDLPTANPENTPPSSEK